jgi:hypothetical protein
MGRTDNDYDPDLSEQFEYYWEDQSAHIVTYYFYLLQLKREKNYKPLIKEFIE